MNRILPCMLLAITISSSVYSQNIFQKIYFTDYDVYCFGAYQVTDGGYIITGIAQVSTTAYNAFMARTNCHGEILWSKTYNTSSTVGNISQRVVETHDHGFLLAASIGNYGAYNILLVRTNANGDALWKKVMQGNGDDLVNSVIETTSHDFVVAGSTSSYGQDAGSFYKDIYLMKVNEEGNFIWGKTYGNHGTYDEAFDVIETFDGHYAATGRYIASEAFHCFLLKTDTAGNVIYLKAYGDTLQNVTGYGIANTLDGNYVITGSSTLTKSSFLDYPDEFLMKINPDGDTLWCKSYHGSNIDGSENGSSVITLNDQSYAIGVATFSYPTSGFVPNKHCILKTDADGDLQWLKAYNDGGSHYPYLTSAKGESGFVLSGFSNEYTPHFSPMIIKMDDDFESGCNEIDYSSLTFQEHMPAKVKTPTVMTGTGGSLTATSVEAEFEMNETVLCSTFSDSCFVFTGINKLVTKDEGPQVYPNPAFDHITADFWSPGSGQMTIEFFNALGKSVYQTTEPVITGENHVTISLESLMPAIYFAKFKSMIGTSIVKFEIIR